jgi:hypothetical protein
MSQAGIVFDEDDHVTEEAFESTAEDTISVFRSLSLSELETELQNAVENEDYERASFIRDEIRKRK